MKQVFRFRLIGKGRANNTWYTGHMNGWYNFCTGESEFKFSDFDVECR
jgi:hypothetical protein